MNSFAYLTTLEQFGIKLGLDNIRAVLEAWGHPERSFRVVHIAGTNGKGSVAAITDSALRAAGHRSGRYTSPHLIDLEERFVINGRPVDSRILADAIADLRTLVDRLLNRGVLQAQPTFFEATTAVAFELFRRAGVEVAVCEVGLGGRLDATNVLEPVATAITTIGMDHEQHLGATLQAIASEKAGIIKAGVPVIVGDLPAEALQRIEDAARDKGAELIRGWSGVDLEQRSSVSGEPGQRFKLRTPVRDYGELKLALAGSHQIGNAVVAVRLLETLDDRGVHVPPDAIVDGLANVSWPGRLERRLLLDGREALLDAAHNRDGAAALAAFLRAEGGRPRPLVFGASQDKDVVGMLHELAPVAAALVLTRASNARSAEPSELAARAREISPQLPLTVAPVPREALQAAWRLSDRIVVAGSIFLLGDVLKELGAS